VGSGGGGVWIACTPKAAKVLVVGVGAEKGEEQSVMTDLLEGRQSRR
jgi:hypothetical protein